MDSLDARVHEVVVRLADAAPLAPDCPDLAVGRRRSRRMPRWTVVVTAGVIIGLAGLVAAAAVHKPASNVAVAGARSAADQPQGFTTLVSFDGPLSDEGIHAMKRCAPGVLYNVATSSDGRYEARTAQSAESVRQCLTGTEAAGSKLRKLKEVASSRRYPPNTRAIISDAGPPKDTDALADALARRTEVFRDRDVSVEVVDDNQVVVYGDLDAEEQKALATVGEVEVAPVVARDSSKKDAAPCQSKSNSSRERHFCDRDGVGLTVGQTALTAADILNATIEEFQSPVEAGRPADSGHPGRTVDVRLDFSPAGQERLRTLTKNLACGADADRAIAFIIGGELVETVRLGADVRCGSGLGPTLIIGFEDRGAGQAHAARLFTAPLRAPLTNSRIRLAQEVWTSK